MIQPTESVAALECIVKVLLQRNRYWAGNDFLIFWHWPHESSLGITGLEIVLTV